MSRHQRDMDLSRPRGLNKLTIIRPLLRGDVSTFQEPHSYTRKQLHSYARKREGPITWRTNNPTNTSFSSSLFPALEAKGECGHCVSKAPRKKWEQISSIEVIVTLKLQGSHSSHQASPVPRSPARACRCGLESTASLCLVLLFPRQIPKSTFHRLQQKPAAQMPSLYLICDKSIYHPCLSCETRNSEKIFSHPEIVLYMW